jgi:hypothetical protein
MEKWVKRRNPSTKGKIREGPSEGEVKHEL